MMQESLEHQPSTSTTYTAWDGATYAGQPPPGWYFADDGRWWPPREQLQDDIRVPLWRRPAAAILLAGLLGLIGAGALLALASSSGEEVPVEVATQPVTSVAPEPPTSEAPAATDAPSGPVVTMPNGDPPFDGYPAVVSISSLDDRVASWLSNENGSTGQAVALAPGVYVLYNPNVRDLWRYYEIGAYGDCIMIDTYFAGAPGACWDGVLPGDQEPAA